VYCCSGGGGGGGCSGGGGCHGGGPSGGADGGGWWWWKGSRYVRNDENKLFCIYPVTSRTLSNSTRGRSGDVAAAAQQQSEIVNHHRGRESPMEVVLSRFLEVCPPSNSEKHTFV
jgi:hypothetical protein